MIYQEPETLIQNLAKQDRDVRAEAAKALRKPVDEETDWSVGVRAVDGIGSDLESCFGTLR